MVTPPRTHRLLMLLWSHTEIRHMELTAAFLRAILSLGVLRKTMWVRKQDDRLASYSPGSKRHPGQRRAILSAGPTQPTHGVLGGSEATLTLMPRSSFPMGVFWSSRTFSAAPSMDAWWFPDSPLKVPWGPACACLDLRV